MLLRALILTSSAIALWSCSQDESTACGEGNVYTDGDCHPASAVSTGQAGEPGAGGTTESSGGAPAAEVTELDPNFGKDCTVDSECSGPTDYCVPKSPVDTQYCTASGCDTDPNICPTGWSCFDLSMFAPGAPFVCARPFN